MRGRNPRADSVAGMLLEAARYASRPLPGKASSPRARHSLRQRSNNSGAPLQLPRHLADPASAVDLSHRRDFQFAVVHSSGQIHTSPHAMYLVP